MPLDSTESRDDIWRRLESQCYESIMTRRWWRVRRADIPEELRERFELYGEQVLERMKKAEAPEINSNVFPGDDGEPLTDIKRTWLSVCKKAGLAKEAEQRTRDGRFVKDKEGKLPI